MASKVERSKRNKFENYCKHIETYFSVSTSREDFYRTGVISFVCKKASHVITIRATSFANKMYFVKDVSLWCDQCNRREKLVERTKQFTEHIDQKNGHQIESVNWSTRNVIYTCGYCGDVRTTCVRNLSKESSSGFCGKCQNNQNRIPFATLREMVEKHGKVLVTVEVDYQNNKQLLDLICGCGKSYRARLMEIKKGKPCPSCIYETQNRKIESTWSKLHGVRNISFLPEIQAKIQQSGYTAKTFTFPSGNTIQVQGYEHFALEHLLQSGASEDMFEPHVPTISYQGLDGKDHIYFPDFFWPNEKTVFEVKCMYTLTKELDTNFSKWEACLERGYKVRVLLFDDGGKLIKDVMFHESIDRDFYLS